MPDILEELFGNLPVYTPPLQMEPVVNGWREKIRLALEYRKKNFDVHVELIEQFRDKHHAFIFDKPELFGSVHEVGTPGTVPRPSFGVSYNKTSEMIDLFGPLLYHRNPQRRVNPKQQWLPPETIKQELAQQLAAQMMPMMPPGMMPPGMAGPAGFVAPPPMGPPSMPPAPGASPVGSQLPPGAPPGLVPPGPMPNGAPAGMAPGMAPMQPDPVFLLNQQIQRQADLEIAKAQLLEMLLNYTPNELNLKEHIRLCVDDGLTGLGFMFTEPFTPPEGKRLIGSFYYHWRDVVTDPDMPSWESVKWIARRKWVPVWQLERDYQQPRGYIKGTSESTDTVAAVEMGSISKEKKQSRTCDLVEVWEIWSKMGAGLRLKDNEMTRLALSRASRMTELCGDYVYMVICPTCPYPLNLHPDLVRQLEDITDEAIMEFLNPTGLMMEAQQMQAMGQPLDPMKQMLVQQVQVLGQMKTQLAWPVPYWKDDDWPATPLVFHPRPECFWPRPHLKSVQGQQVFLDWGYSAMASKIAQSHRQFMAISKAISQETEDAILAGKDFELIKLDLGQKNINELVQFLTYPPFNKDQLEVMKIMEDSFNKGSGLTEGLYGQTATQSRSAQDSAQKASAQQIRPDDMAERVENLCTQIARKEGIASRLLLRYDELLPIVGHFGAQYWEANLAGENDSVFREFDYRIEASSTRKPNKELDVQNTSEGVQFLMPILQQIAMNPQVWNWGPLMTFMREWAKARNWDIEQFLVGLPPPPPMMPMPAPGGEPPGEAPPTEAA